MTKLKNIENIQKKGDSSLDTNIAKTIKTSKKK